MKRAGRRTRWSIFTGALIGAWMVFYWMAGNVPRHSEQWTRDRIDLAIERGLEFLVNSEAFARRVGEGGEHIIHHYILDLILAKEPHLRLRRQQELCDQNSRELEDWRVFLGLPGRPRVEMTPEARAEIQKHILEHPNPYERWLLHAVHADWATLPAHDHRLLFDDTTLQASGYDLTHALFAYWLMEQTAPDAAFRLGIRYRMAEIVPRINRYIIWGPRCSDGYLERVSFLLILNPPPKISRRWIERIINTQNEDLGWTMVPPYYRTLQELFGLPITSQPSQPHSTFLALLALTSYRDQLRSEEKARSHHRGP